ncbi:hypothetical protein [Nostoc sp.]
MKKTEIYSSDIEKDFLDLPIASLPNPDNLSAIASQFQTISQKKLANE